MVVAYRLPFNPGEVKSDQFIVEFVLSLADFLPKDALSSSRGLMVWDDEVKAAAAQAWKWRNIARCFIGVAPLNEVKEVNSLCYSFFHFWHEGFSPPIPLGRRT